MWKGECGCALSGCTCAFSQMANRPGFLRMPANVGEVVYLFSRSPHIRALLAVLNGKWGDIPVYQFLRILGESLIRGCSGKLRDSR